MIQIDVTDKEPAVFKTPSKGNQEKWNIDSFWYKKDYGGFYQALSEVISSRILEKSNLTDNPLTGIQDFVVYDFAKITIHGIAYPGCVSRDFKRDNEELWSLEKYILNHHNFSFADAIYKNISKYAYGQDQDRDEYAPIKYYVNTVNNLGIDDYGSFLTAVLELDALILNADRHTNNLGVLLKTDQLRICPVFDNGAAFFSDIVNFPETDQLEKLYWRAEKRPFYHFDKQKKLCEELYGRQFQTCFSKADLDNILNEAADIYPDDLVLRRVENFVSEQLDKYKNDLVFDILKNYAIDDMAEENDGLSMPGED